jgi:uncharacterized cupredoxin-like copper-binding protein
MIRPRLLTLALLVALPLLWAAGGAGVHSAAAAPVRAQPTRAAARLLVYAQEWSLWPSRTSVPAGKVIVELWNRGQDPHDLQIRRLTTHGAMVGRAQALGVTESGQIKHAVWTLGRGTYELYCSMAGHMKLGMHARLTVR